MRRFMRSTAVTEPNRFVTSSSSTSGLGRRRSRRGVGADAAGWSMRRWRRGSGRRSTGGPRGRTIRALSGIPVASLQVGAMVRARRGPVNASVRANLARSVGLALSTRRGSAEPILQPAEVARDGSTGGRRADTETDLRLGARIRALRQARRLTLRAVADRPGVTESFLSQVERDVTSPSIATVGRIARPSTSRSPSSSPRSRRRAGSCGARLAAGWRTPGSSPSTSS